MANSLPFSRAKFSDLTCKQQHKHLAKLVRELYLLEKVEPHLCEPYHTLCSWINSPPLPGLDRESLSDRYHIHMKQANETLREPDFLPKISCLDKASPIAPPLPYTIYLDNLRSAHNVGSILRTAEAFGLQEVLLSQQTPGPENKQVRDTSMGAWEHIHCQRTSSPPSDFPIIALETSPEAISIDMFTPPPKATFVVGNEEYGISRDLLSKANMMVTIPLYGCKNSLNVANAFAILAASLRRKRNEHVCTA